MSFICTICNKSFTTNGGLKRHNLSKKTICSITNVITEDRKFQCSHCNRCFTTNQTYSN